MNSNHSYGSNVENIDWSLIEKFHPGGAAEDQRTKLRIFFAAARLFAQKGYRGTAVREIVQDAGVTKPTLYYYFSNKEDLYLQLIDMAMGTFSRLLERSVAHTGSQRERLMNFFKQVMELFEGNIDMLRLVNLLVYAPKDSVPPYDLKPRHEQIRAALRNLLLPQIHECSHLPEQSVETGLLLLIGLFRSLQIHLFIPEIGEPLTLGQIAAGVDAILGATGLERPEVEPA